MIRIYDYLYELSDDQINQLYGHSNQPIGNAGSLESHSLAPCEGDYSQSQWVCRAVFQSLNHLSQNIVMRLLFINTPITLNELFTWFHPSISSSSTSQQLQQQQQQQYFQSTLNELTKSRIILKINHNEIIMNKGFQESMKYSLSGIHEPWIAAHKTNLTLIIDKNAPNKHQLHEECIHKWNNILQYMITTDSSLNISNTVVNYLLEAGLMHYIQINSPQQEELHIRINTSGNPQPTKKLCITSKGYEYLLLDIQTQVWNFAYECLKKSGSHQIEVLSFLFMLSFCRVGNSYPVSQLTPIQVQLMMEFTHLGIIYRASPQSARFYPSQIAVNIISGSGSGTATHKLKSLTSLSPELNNDSTPTSASTASASASVVEDSSSSSSSSTPLPSSNLSGLELIVETNFQVVAYFTSDLHLAMLSLFVDNRGLVRLPNMALGQITRDSIKYALKMGIKSHQIINFMKIHTHSRFLNRHPIIPENVTDQIKLWESERTRLKMQPSTLLNLHEITSGRHLEELYLLLKSYSREINVLLWFDDQKKCLVVTTEGYFQLDAYARTLDS